MKHLLHVFSTFDPGGPQVRTARMVAALGSEYRHSFVGLDGKTGARDLLPTDVETHILPGPRKGPMHVLRWTRRLLTSAAPELLLTYNWGAIEVVLGARFTGASVLHHEDGFLPEESRKLLPRRTWTRRLLLPGVKGVVVPSHKLQTIASETWKLDRTHVHLIPNGVRLEDFQREQGGGPGPSLRTELGIPATACVIGSVGHLRPEKNPVRLVEGFARTARRESAHLLILGDGPERGRLEGAVAEHGLGARVHIIGHCVEPRPYYAAMDVFCISSDTEQMPVALLEAMASELAVCSTDVGDVRRMLPDVQAGWIAGNPAEDPRSGTGADATAALAAVLDEAIGDEPRRRRLAAANAEHVARTFTFEGMVQTYRALYRAAGA